MVHASAQEAARESLRDGADGLVHVFQDQAADAEFVALAKQRGAFVVRRAECGADLGEPSADRSTQGERVSCSGTSAGAQCFVALRETGFRRAQTRFGDHRRAARIVDAAGGHRTFGE